MEYIFNLKSWGKMFTVPCSVVDEHIKIADGKFIKVLLCILCNNSNKISSNEIAVQIGEKVELIEDAIIFWQQNNVITIEGTTSSQSKPAPVQEDNSIQNIQITQSKIEAINPNPNSISKKTTVKYSPRDIEKIVDKSSDLKFLMDNAQIILKRTITYTEQSALINLNEYYGFSVGVILMLFDYCQHIGKTNIAYIEAIAKSWFEKDIITHEAVEKEIIRLIDKNSFESKVSQAFGLSNKLTPKQQQFIEEWKNLGFNIEMITYAYEKCVDSTNKLSFQYINGILKSWFEKGLKTKEQVDSENKKYKKSAENKNEHSYDLDEFYKKVLNNTTFKG